MPRAYHITPAIERFHRHYIPEPNSGCWLWTAALSRGRPMFCISPRRVNTQAARFIWAHMNGPIPEGHHICHRCDTPECVNPDHLFLGTPLDNVRDMMRKGRDRFQETGRMLAARAAARTHCKNGHELTPDNVDARGGRRICITCRRISTRRAVAKHYAKHRADRAEQVERWTLQRAVRAIEISPLSPAEREARPLTPWPDEVSA